MYYTHKYNTLNLTVKIVNSNIVKISNKSKEITLQNSGNRKL